MKKNTGNYKSALSSSSTLYGKTAQQHSKETEQTRLTEEYHKLEVQADSCSEDPERIFSIFKRSYEISTRLTELCTSNENEKCYWMMETCDNLTGLCFSYMNNHDLENGLKKFDEAKDLFSKIKKPQDNDLNKTYLELKDSLEKHSSLLSMIRQKSSNAKPQDSEGNIFTPADTFLSSRSTIYGTKGQEYYNNASLQIINDTAKEIADWVENGDDLQSRLKDLLKTLAKKRHDLAVETGTQNAKNFGLIRPTIKDSTSTWQKKCLPEDSHEVAATPLTKHYSSASNDIKKLLVKALKKYAEDGTCEINLSFDGGKYNLTITILDRSKIEELFKDNTKKERFIFHQFQLTRSQLNLQSVVAGFISADFSLVIDNEKHIITSFSTTFKTQNQDRIQKVTKLCLTDFEINSKVLMINRGDEISRQHLINEIGVLFEQAVKCDISDTQTLNDLIAKIHYKKTILNYTHRGSAADTEWLVGSLYKYHGFKLAPFKLGVRIDLKAFAQPYMAVFINEYPNFYEQDPTSASKQEDQPEPEDEHSNILRL